jgi:two-component system chemotaxis sensor kinase CheA
MSKKENDFQKKLLAMFKIEAEEHINAISSGLIELEKTPSNEKQMEIIESVFREAHSLKGAARAVNMMEIDATCQSVESVFAALKRGEVSLSPELFDVLHRAVDTLNNLLLSTDAKRTDPKSFPIEKLIQKLESTRKGVPQPPGKKKFKEKIEGEAPVSMPAETVRIPTAKLDSILLQAEELISAKLAASQSAAELREINAAPAVWEKEWAKIRADVRTIQHYLERNGETNIKKNSQGKSNLQMMKFLRFLEWNSTFVKSLEGKLKSLSKSVEHNYRSLDSMVENLLDDTKKVLMLPFSSLLDIFPNFVRNLSRDQGKEAELVIQGEEIEIDRRILEEMKDPLIHLVRNCIDHGIEKPKERVRKKKTPCGIVTIAISQKNSSNVEILIADDGAGINLKKVKSAAVKLGIISKEEKEKLTKQEVLSLIFQSGISTSPIVTDISGRGLGLSIVQEKVEKLGGTVSFETHSHAGTKFLILLPVTFATFRGILVRLNEHLFVLPSANVERVARVNKEEIKTVENRETILLDRQAVSLVHLRDVLELTRKSKTRDSSNNVQVVVLGSAEKRIAFIVDEVLNEQEVLVKSLGRQLSRVSNIAGATVLGTGKVVLILNIPDLMKSAVHVSTIDKKPGAVPLKKDDIKRKSILVTEDSITARSLLKNILESAGYNVKTAVNGVDAFTALKPGDFDLVVSDVDMPRMNGFDLTAKIRSDKKLHEIPVVLVTALETREDRERGIDVGANAYIVKSSFDQSNLLEVIRRLI